MNLLLKRLSILLMLLLFGTAIIACDRTTVTTQTTNPGTTTTETTTQENTTTSTPWQTEVEIRVSGSYKTVYELGEALDTSLMVVESVNGLGFKMQITSENYTITGYDANTVGIQVVSINYKDLSTTFAVYVKEAMTFANFTLELTLPTKTSYSVGEEFDPTGLVVKLVAEDESYITLSNTQYTVSGFSSSTSGTKNITVSTLGLETSFTITVTGSNNLSAYYQSAEGLTGQALKLQLRTIVTTGFVAQTYGSGNTILGISDRDPNNPSNVYLLYNGASVSGTWDQGSTWNKEHVWPKSLLGIGELGNSDKNIATDMHNLRACNPSINSSRGNKYYANATNSLSFGPSAVFKDDHRGDVARIIFYMAVRYSILSIVNTNGSISTYQFAQLDVLLEWHELDPVDNFERNRNEVIFSYQKNRNPFIDYPHFVDLIW